METPTALDTGSLEARVKKMYSEVAREPFAEYHFEMGRKLAEKLGYSPGDLDLTPSGAIDSFAGVGCFIDLLNTKDGATVVDLGSGSGMDAFIAALKVSPKGKVIGIDMTEDQLAKSRRLAKEHGFANIEFIKAYIEDTPVDDASTDVVISNGVINLSPNKKTVFEEAARILKTGGQLVLADIVSDVKLPESITCNSALWASCIGGAIPLDDYTGLIENAGFELRQVRENDAYAFISKSAVSATTRYGIKSISLVAIRR